MTVTSIPSRSNIPAQILSSLCVEIRTLSESISFQNGVEQWQISAHPGKADGPKKRQSSLRLYLKAHMFSEYGRHSSMHADSSQKKHRRARHKVLWCPLDTEKNSVGQRNKLPGPLIIKIVKCLRYRK